MPESTSAGIIGGFQALNVLTIIMLVQAMKEQKANINKVMVVVLFLVFQIYTYIRYIYREKHSVKVIEEKWLNKTESARKQTKFLLYFYGVISIASCFGLAIYLGSRS